MASVLHVLVIFCHFLTIPMIIKSLLDKLPKKQLLMGFSSSDEDEDED
jgi:hypothetical protein